jgi:hypothetical protein
MSLDEWRMAYQQEIAKARSGEYGYCKCHAPKYDREHPKHCKVCEKPHKQHYLEAKRRGGKVHEFATIVDIDFHRKIVYFSGSEHLQSAPLSNVAIVDNIEIGDKCEFYYNFLTDPIIFLCKDDKGDDEFRWIENL